MRFSLYFEIFFKQLSNNLYTWICFWNKFYTIFLLGDVLEQISNNLYTLRYFLNKFQTIFIPWDIFGTNFKQSLYFKIFLKQISNNLYTWRCFWNQISNNLYTLRFFWNKFQTIFILWVFFKHTLRFSLNAEIVSEQTRNNLLIFLNWEILLELGEIFVKSLS